MQDNTKTACNQGKIKCDFAELKCDINKIKCDIISLKSHFIFVFVHVLELICYKTIKLMYIIQVLSDGIIIYTYMDKSFNNIIFITLYLYQLTINIKKIQFDFLEIKKIYIILQTQNGGVAQLVRASDS